MLRLGSDDLVRLGLIGDIAKRLSRPCIGFAPSTLRLDFFSHMDEDTLTKELLHVFLEVLDTAISKPLGASIAEVQRATDTATAQQ